MKGSPLLSPKITKSDSKEEEQRQFLMKKRSPNKFEEKEVGLNTSVGYG